MPTNDERRAKTLVGIEHRQSKRREKREERRRIHLEHVGKWNRRVRPIDDCQKLRIERLDPTIRLPTSWLQQFLLVIILIPGSFLTIFTTEEKKELMNGNKMK